MWVIDIRHWLGENLLEAGLPQLRLKVKKLGEIITYATANEAAIMVDFQPACSRRPQMWALCPTEEATISPVLDSSGNIIN
jgi:hypothetical protein